MANQKTAHHYAAAAIRKHYRNGMSVDELAEMYDQSEYVIQKMLRTRTIEAAAKVLNELENTPEVVRRYLHNNGHITDFTNLIQTRTE